MANISVTFYHHTSNSSLEADVNSAWSVDYTISELQHNTEPPFLQPLEKADMEYRLVVKRTSLEIRGETTLEEAGVESGDALTVVIRPLAG